MTLQPSGNRPWLGPRKLLSSQSERLPEEFRELYLATLRDIDDVRAKRRNSVVQAFEGLWEPALNQLNLPQAQRLNALNELIEMHILYRCLRSSLDRAPQLAAVRRDIEAIRNKITKAYEKLRRLSDFSEFLMKEQELLARSRGGTARVRRRIDDALLSRLFEIRARDALAGSLSNFDHLIQSVWGREIPKRRGQPQKYSKDFLILRCARIYERYCLNGRAVIRKYPDHSDDPPESYDRGPFYRFVLNAISTVEVTFRPAAFGMEKSIVDMLRVRKKHPDVDLLVHPNSSTDNLVKFAGLIESKKK